MKTKSWLFVLLAALGLQACQLDAIDGPSLPLSHPTDVPFGFSPMPIPADNYPTTERVALGKKLFYDPILSRDSSISCGSCHFQSLGFTDGKSISLGIEDRPGMRNAPTLANLAWHPYFFFDGGVPTMELQILAPIDAHFEMDMPLLALIERFQAHPTYPAMFRRAYGRGPDAFGLTRAIAAFERTLVSGDSPWDRQQNGLDPQAMSAAALRGWELFQSERLHCRNCHSGFDFSDYSFQNIGLAETPGDSGRMRITLDEADRGKFKTPSLRNIALSAPYMHDGSIATLSEVIDHFASGGLRYANQSPLVQGFTLSDTEKADLIEFLHSLTDESFIQNPAFAQ